jgi:acyl-CoA thioesterase-2
MMQPVPADLRSESTVGDATLLDLLTLEELDRDLYRSTVLFSEEHALYGGQVAAQALMAAGRTVAPDLLPHSLHGYFLRSGDPARHTIFRVDRDRDGRSFSARRVVAVQGGEVIFSMSASFHVPDEGDDHQVHPAPQVAGPDGLPGVELHRMFSMETRKPPQPYPDAPLPTRFWARTTIPLPDSPLVHAAVLTYLSDVSTGLIVLPDAEAALGPSLDHAVWFHRDVRMDDWVLVDLVPHTVAHHRGWYTGSILTRDGVLAGSLAQEALFRRSRER